MTSPTLPQSPTKTYRFTQLRSAIATAASIAVASLSFATSLGQVQAAPLASDGPGDGLRASGIVSAMPSGSLFGSWTISGTTYLAVAGITEFRLSEGMLSVGKCAEVAYKLQSTDRIALRMEADDNCGTSGDHDGDDTHVSEFKGVIDSFPADLIGTWTVGGRVFTATESTHFEQKDGPFAAGQCVEVKTQAASANALEIESHPFCGVGPLLMRARGLITTLPDDAGLRGTWTVNTTTYEVISNTVLQQQHGSFVVGGCVNVYFDSTTITRTARKIESESLDDCAPRTMTPTLEARGLVSSRPPTGTVFGAWIIGGQSYEAISSTTRFNQEHGLLSIGDCAQVKYLVQNGARVAVRISSESEHACGAPGEGREAYGAIRALPAGGLIGIWQIGDASYVVSTTTRLQGPFVVGAIVEVKYVRLADGTLLASKIERKGASESERRFGKAYGLISTRPATPTVIGTWVIASNTYSVTSSTQVTGSLLSGECAQVYYTLAADGTRVAIKLKGEGSGECARDREGKSVNKAFGFVTEMPAGGFVGTWVIGGATYESSVGTEFNEQRFALTTGAFVEVTYVMSNGVRSALEIEAETPPNAGEKTEYGTVTIVNGSITVNGQPITVTQGTMIDESRGEFRHGAHVYVNLTANASPAAGIQAVTPVRATKIMVVNQIYRIVLPVVNMQ